MAEHWGFAPDQDSAFFISYNSRDWQRIAPIAGAMKNMGYPLWYDYGLQAGTARWKTQISVSLDRCYAVILFVTRGIFDRQRCYVINEYDEAAGIKKVVIPVFLDNISLNEVPTDYRAYVTEWNSIQGVPYKEESPQQTAARIARVIEHSRRINFSLPGNAGTAAPPETVWQEPVESSLYHSVPQPSKGFAGRGKRKKAFLISAAVVLAAAAVLGIFFIPSLTNDPALTDDTAAIPSGITAGDHLTFGSYPQKYDEPEPIEWRVLAVDDGKALLISEYLLDANMYDYDSAVWESSELRNWLNNDFYNKAFSKTEQKRIIMVTNQNPGNPVYGTEGCGPTDDYVFCLSLDEANKYFPYDGGAAPTAYAIDNGAIPDPSWDTCWWWLRSPGLSSDRASDMDAEGHIHSAGSTVSLVNSGVRPVVWVSLSD